MVANSNVVDKRCRVVQARSRKRILIIDVSRICLSPNRLMSSVKYPDPFFVLSASPFSIQDVQNGRKRATDPAPQLGLIEISD